LASNVGGGAGGSDYIGGCLTTATAFTAAGSSGSSSGQASTYNSLDASYQQGIALGGLPGTSTSTSSNGNGGNGLVVITPVTSLPSTYTAPYSGGVLTYAVPAGVNYLLVKLWGAGGGGATYDTSDSSLVNYGGGAGGYTQCYLSVTPGQTLSVVRH
jgi:hypothetical protein